MVREVVQRRTRLIRAQQGAIDQCQFGITFGECTEGYAVPPGGSCGVAVILTPSVEGPISGAIKISESGFDAITVQSKITGAGGLPALTADQGSYHHFETLKVGESRSEERRGGKEGRA